MIRYHYTTSEGPQWMVKVPNKPQAWMTLSHFLGYNPQRLLTYRPQTLREWADEQVAKFRAAYPRIAEMWHDEFTGGIIKPRPYQQEAMQAIMNDRNEFILPKGRIVWPTITERPGIDFGQMEARIVRQYATPKVLLDTTKFRATLQVAADAARRMEESLRKYREAHARQNDEIVFRSLFGHGGLASFPRESRIAKLMESRDRRQRKRGIRLFNRWWYNRKRVGLNVTRRQKNDILMRGYSAGAMTLNQFVHGDLGEVYDPERYRKD